MRDREYRIGPGAVSLLLVVVVVSMSVLGLLALISSRGDYALTERSTLFVVNEYNTSAKAEETLASLDEILLNCEKDAKNDQEYLEAIAAALPEDMILMDRAVSWTEEAEGGRSLFCEVEILPLDDEERFVRRSFMFMVSETEDLFD